MTLNFKKRFKLVEVMKVKNTASSANYLYLLTIITAIEGLYYGSIAYMVAINRMTDLLAQKIT